MGNVTTEQKLMLNDLANRYDERVVAILKTGGDETIDVMNDARAAILESFADKIVEVVGNDFPDFEGKDRDINDNAQLAVFVISRVISRYSKTKGIG